MLSLPEARHLRELCDQGSWEEDAKGGEYLTITTAKTVLLNGFPKFRTGFRDQQLLSKCKGKRAAHTSLQRRSVDLTEVSIDGGFSSLVDGRELATSVIAEASAILE